MAFSSSRTQLPSTGTMEVVETTFTIGLYSGAREYSQSAKTLIK